MNVGIECVRPCLVFVDDIKALNELTVPVRDCHHRVLSSI